MPSPMYLWLRFRIWLWYQCTRWQIEHAKGEKRERILRKVDAARIKALWHLKP